MDLLGCFFRLGIAEGQVLLQLNHHLQNFEAEKHKLLAQVKLLCQENTWLRDELGSTQKKIHQCEQNNASYSAQIEHLKFFKEIEHVVDSTMDDEGDLTNDLFPVDDHLPSPSHSSEIPIRLKTLHNLVLQYASQGRHEIAIPLCRQALEDLEQTTGHQRKQNSVGSS